jgi:hypothetical protein
MPWRLMGQRMYTSTFHYPDTGWRWSASRPSRFTTGANRIGGWVDPRASLDATQNIKMSDPYRKSIPGCLACRLVAIPTELSRPGHGVYWLRSLLMFLDKQRQMLEWNLKRGHWCLLPLFPKQYSPAAILDTTHWELQTAPLTTATSQRSSAFWAMRSCSPI